MKKSFFLILLSAGLAQAEPFTFQGKLDFNGGAVNSQQDFIFKLLDGPNAQTANVVATLPLQDVPVSNGVFSVSLDFGMVFDGAPYWVSVEVRPGNSTGGYTELNPPQAITATPEAQVSLYAAPNSVNAQAIVNGSVGLAHTDGTLQAAIGQYCQVGDYMRGVASNGNITCGSLTPAWSMQGNYLVGTTFIGSTNDKPVEVRVNNQPVARFIHKADYLDNEHAPHLILGSRYNEIYGGVLQSGSTISGGSGFTGDSYCGDGSQVCTQYILGSYSTIAGGWGNRIAGDYSVISGGQANYASVKHAAVLGGLKNRATEEGAVVLGGFENHAGGRFSLAAGYRAVVRDAAATGVSYGDIGTFVWADNYPNQFISTGSNQFLIRARGGMGVGTNAPQNQLHVVERVAGTADSPGSHVMQVENISTDTGVSGDVLALVLSGVNNPGGASNYITFYEKDGFDANSDPDPIAAIEGNGAGGVVYKTSGADFAEYLPAETDFTPGSVVGMKQGRLVADVHSAEKVLVISSAPALVGNADMNGNRGRALAALLGQVPVNVAGKVAAGDWLLATGDGRARALGADELAEVDLRRVVGKALSADENGQATVLVGLPPQALTQAALLQERERNTQQAARLRQLETRLAEQQQQLQAQRQLLVALQNRQAEMARLEARLHTLLAREGLSVEESSR